MKKKLGNITLKEFNDICMKHESQFCDGCPFNNINPRTCYVIGNIVDEEEFNKEIEVPEE